jgi:hypothetical protein
MSGRNENLAIELGVRLGLPADAVEAALADSMIVRFQRDDVYGAAFARGITLTDVQLEAVMDLVVRRFDPAGLGLSWAAIDAATDEVTGRS